MNSAPSLQLQNISHSFGAHQVLNSINLELQRGSITALLGPSGGGKTTLLRVIAGFEKPEEGMVSINGKTVSDSHVWLAPKDRGVAIVPQEGALFPHLSVGENVAFGLKKRRSTASRLRVREMLNLVGLPDASSMRPSELSGGMQQRVALARALATNPAVVLLDEPFSALDANLRETLREQVVAILRTAGATAIWVTHDQDEALSIADTVAVLLDGHIAQISDPVSLYRMPETLNVAGFIGEAVVLPAVVEADKMSVSTRFGESQLLRPHTTGEAQVIIRPEQFEIIQTDHSDVAITGIVNSTQYFGHDGTVEVQLSDGLVVSVRLHARLLPEVGSQVGVIVNGRILAFDK